MKSADRLFLSLFSLLLLAGVACAAPATGRVSGRIDCQAAACLGVAALWRADQATVPAPDRYLLTPVVVSALEADGSFELIAPVGDYFAGAQLRKTPGPLFGAPRVGDYIYLIKPQDDTGYRLRVEKDGHTDIGAHSKYWIFSGLTREPEMGISGQVLDLHQQPVAGLLVFAFADPQAMTEPLAVSARTDATGRFVLPLARSGAVYLRARKSYRGGQPQAEDYITLQGETLRPVVVSAGQVTSGKTVLVRKLPAVLLREKAPDTARPNLQ